MKPLRNDEIALSFTDLSKSCPGREFKTCRACLYAIRETKILAEISDFTVYNFKNIRDLLQWRGSNIEKDT